MLWPIGRSTGELLIRSLGTHLILIPIATAWALKVGQPDES